MAIQGWQRVCVHCIWWCLLISQALFLSSGALLCNPCTAGTFSALSGQIDTKTLCMWACILSPPSPPPTPRPFSHFAPIATCCTLWLQLLEETIQLTPRLKMVRHANAKSRRVQNQSKHLEIELCNWIIKMSIFLVMQELCFAISVQQEHIRQDPVI